MRPYFAAEWRAANPDKVWFGSTSCSLCYWSAQVQGGGPQEMFAALKAHYQSHPEWDAFQASLPSITEVREAIHAECNHRTHRCPCICGCEEILPCDCWSDMCSVCEIRLGRGDDEHGRSA